MRIWKALPLVLCLVGCSSIPLTALVLDGSQSTATAAPTAAATQIVLSNGTFTLTLLSPQDQAIVSMPNIDVKGKVSEQAVLTINGNTVLLKPGPFTQSVALQAGLNAIQIVASDMAGDEIDTILTVTYQP
jgi:hypothetical protein